MTESARPPRQGFNLAGIKTQIEALNAALVAKITERRELTAKIEEINSLPPDRQAIKELLISHVDELASAYPGALRRQIEPYLLNPTKGAFLQKNVLSLLQCSTKPMISELGVPAPPTGLFFLLRAQIKTALVNAVDEMELPEGMPSDQRRAQLAELTARLGVIDSELRELFDAAGDLGISLPSEVLSPQEKETRRKVAAAAARAAAEPPMTEIPELQLPGDAPGTRPVRATPYEV